MRHRISSTLERFHRFGPTLVAGLALALLWSFVLWSTSLQQERLLAESQRSLDLINRALGEQTAGLLRDASTDLRLLDAWMQRNPGADPLRDAEYARFVATLSHERRELVSLHVVGADGRVLDPPQGAEGLTVAVSESGITLSDPKHMGGQSWLPLVLPRHTRGRPVKALVALIDVDRLVQLHDGLRVQPAGSILLMRDDGTVLSRAPLIEGLVGKRLPYMTANVAEMLRQPSGAFVSEGEVTDGMRRLATFRRVEGFPVTLIVAQGYDQALASFGDRWRLVLGVCVGFTVFAFAALLLILRMQRSARVRQAELAAVSADAPVGMFRAATDGRLVYVNDAYLRIHGFAREQASEGWLTMLPADQRDHARAEWLRIVQGNEPWHAVRRLVRADGSELLAAIHTSPVMIDGHVTGHVGTLRDITDQARGERALRTLAAIFEATTDFVVQTDARGRMLHMNPAARRFIGLAPDAPIDHLNYADLAPPVTVARHDREIIPMVLERGMWSGETLQWNAQRREVLCSHTLIAHRDHDGRISVFSAVMRDISAARAAQQVVERSEATLRAVAEAMPAIMSVVDRNERIVFANSAFERWQGRSRDMLMGRTIREVLGDDEHARRAPWIARVLGGENVSFELDDASRHLRTTFIPLRAADGTPDGFVAVTDDITEHRNETDRLRELSRADALTGALNRAGFEHLLAQRAREGGKGLAALLFIDLDRFKQVNDTYGHAAGDTLLKSFAERVRGLVRPTDTLGRLGGDEFVILLDGLREPVNAEHVADKIVAAAQRPFQIDGKSVHISASIGVALWREEQRDWRSLLAQADAMLYRAKQSGRGQHCLAA